MDKPEFDYVIYIASTPEQLWKALTRGDITQHYWGGRRIESEWEPGAAVRLVKPDGALDWEGEVLEAARPRYLSYSFKPADDEMPEFEGESVDLQKHEPPSRVNIEIHEYMRHSRLMLLHDRFEPGSRVFQGISYGWPVVLSSLKTWLERGDVLFPRF